MAETRETGPAVARSCLGGLTLLLALTLSVRAVAISTGVPAHRPAVVHAVARFLAAAERAEQPATAQAEIRITAHVPEIERAPLGVVLDAADGLRPELISLPPPGVFEV